MGDGPAASSAPPVTPTTAGPALFQRFSSRDPQVTKQLPVDTRPPAVATTRLVITPKNSIVGDPTERTWVSRPAAHDDVHRAGQFLCRARCRTPSKLFTASSRWWPRVWMSEALDSWWRPLLTADREVLPRLGHVAKMSTTQRSARFAAARPGFVLEGRLPGTRRPQPWRPNHGTSLL